MSVRTEQAWAKGAHSGVLGLGSDLVRYVITLTGKRNLLKVQVDFTLFSGYLLCNTGQNAQAIILHKTLLATQIYILIFFFLQAVHTLCCPLLLSTYSILQFSFCRRLKKIIKNFADFELPIYHFLLTLQYILVVLFVALSNTHHYHYHCHHYHHHHQYIIITIIFITCISFGKLTCDSGKLSMEF